MNIKDECWWYKDGWCDADHCEQCMSLYYYYKEEEGCTPT